MAEKDKIFSSKLKYSGVLDFAAFYKFCYEWLRDEAGLGMAETKYAEKLSGDSKSIDVEWGGSKEVSDYFKLEVKVSFKVIGLTNIEVVKGNEKVKMNKGSIEVGISGTIVKDYKGKFEKSAFQKFLRGVYEKTVIPTRIEQIEGKAASDCDEFIAQAKSYLDLEGRR